jgi:hypothetical protein
MGLIELLILAVLLILVLGSVPAYPYSRSWGYYPSGGLATVLVVVLLLIILF